MFGHGADSPLYVSQVFCVWRPRQELYERINLRTQHMYDAGLIDEVIALQQAFPAVHHNVATSIGVAEANSYLQGLCTLPEAQRITSKRTRKYAKRQLTWWRNRQDVTWVAPQ
jgi:tRNA dimethylallyltransferase